MDEITLRAARVNAGLTLDEVSEKVGTSVTTLSNWENHKTFPTARQFKTLCLLYKQSMDRIFVPDELTKS